MLGGLFFFPFETISSTVDFNQNLNASKQTCLKGATNNHRDSAKTAQKWILFVCLFAGLFI